MATLSSNPIKASAGKCADYINNLRKTIPFSDVHYAFSYINGEHADEKYRIYTNGHNGCSCDQELAMRQFELSKNLYYQAKGDATEQGVGEVIYYSPEDYFLKTGKKAKKSQIAEDGSVVIKKTPTIAEHIYISFTERESERLSHEEMNDITRELCERTFLRDFYCISNHHYNTDNSHTHILANGYSKDGTKKINLNKYARYELRMELDHICYEHGLSIIEDPALLRNKQYREWFEQVKAEGKIEIIPHNGASHNNRCSQKGSYKRWLDQQKALETELTENQLKQKRVDERYYYDKRYRTSKDNKVYVVCRFHPSGYKRSSLELTFLLIKTIIEKERQYHNIPECHKTDNGSYIVMPDGHRLYTKTDHYLQQLYDNMKYGGVYAIRDSRQATDRVKFVGAEMNEVKTARAKYVATVSKGEDLYKAIKAYEEMKPKVEGVENPDVEDLNVYNEAYRIMAAHKCTSVEDREDFLQRRSFAEKKIPELDAKLQRLKKEYAKAKQIEDGFENSDKIVRECLEEMIGIQKEFDRTKNGVGDVDILISSASEKADNFNKENTFSAKNTKNFEKTLDN